MTELVRTLHGDADAARLGVVDSHDHLFLRTPALPGLELDDVEAAADELRTFAAAGGHTVVQWTPAGMGRRLAELAAIGARSGVVVVAATGRHRAAHYPPGHPLAGDDEAALTARFVRDVEGGCGLVKVGVGDAIDRFERASLAAAAAAHLRTGAPIALHLEHGTEGERALAILAGHGVAAEAVVLGHVGRHPDPGRVAELATTGAYLCLDGARPAQEWALAPLVDVLVASGHVGQVLLGGDTTTRTGRASAGGPGLAGMLLGPGAVIAGRWGDEAAHAVLVANPRRAWQLRRATTCAPPAPARGGRSSR